MNGWKESLDRIIVVWAERKSISHDHRWTDRIVCLNEMPFSRSYATELTGETFLLYVSTEMKRKISAKKILNNWSREALSYDLVSRWIRDLQTEILLLMSFDQVADLLNALMNQQEWSRNL